MICGFASAAPRQSTSRTLGVLAANERTARFRPSTLTPLYGGRLMVATTRQRLPVIERAAARSVERRAG